MTELKAYRFSILRDGEGKTVAWMNLPMVVGGKIAFRN